MLVIFSLIFERTKTKLLKLLFLCSQSSFLKFDFDEKGDFLFKDERKRC